MFSNRGRLLKQSWFLVIMTNMRNVSELRYHVMILLLKNIYNDEKKKIE